ncbi:MAG: hypothetical protein PHQ22_10600 [Sulfuricurvum sp.]|nr:hypothetical protein [Sulfuricurvum sp.]
MTYPTNTAPKPPQTFGNIQNNYVFRMSQFIGNDQITIVEDLPKNRPVRQATKKSAKGNDYVVYLIKIDFNGFVSDLEMFGHELNTLAVACPKGTENFKGITLVHNGRSLVYLSTDAPLDPSVPRRTDTRQPDLSAPAQAPTEDVVLNNMRQMLADIKTLTKLGVAVKVDQVIKICDTIAPGKALDMIARAKSEGFMYEKDGVYTVV